MTIIDAKEDNGHEEDHDDTFFHVDNIFLLCLWNGGRYQSK